jgi:hypothetical protein
VIWKLVFKVYRKSGAFKREWIQGLRFDASLQLSHVLGEYIAHEAKFPGIRSYLPIPSSEHEAPLVIRGDSPKGDISWLLVSFPDSILTLVIQTSPMPLAFLQVFICARRYSKGLSCAHGEAWTLNQVSTSIRATGTDWLALI